MWLVEMVPPPLYLWLCQGIMSHVCHREVIVSEVVSMRVSVGVGEVVGVVVVFPVPSRLMGFVFMQICG